MVSEEFRFKTLGEAKAVLILVLVEDGLRVFVVYQLFQLLLVLILVLVEDGLRVRKILVPVFKDGRVLILVLVEDGLRGTMKLSKEIGVES